MLREANPTPQTKPCMRKAVLYIRSTPTNQPARQRPRIQQYLNEHKIEVVAEEVERAGSKVFPAFKRALEQADGRLIIISNLGQMVKSPTFMRLLGETGSFVVPDTPDCRPDTLDTLRRAAEELTAATRVRIKESLEVLKKKGVPLGSHIPGCNAGAEALRRHAGVGPKVAAKMRSQRAADYYQFVMPRIVELRKPGMSHEKIAKALNDEGQTMQNGGPYHEVAILRLKRRWEQQHGKIAAEFDKPGRR